MRNAPTFSYLLFFAALIMGSLGVYAQTIDNVTITGIPVCKPGSIQISFRVTNGNGNGSHFTSETNYILRLETLNGTTFNEVPTNNNPLTGVTGPTTPIQGNSLNGAFTTLSYSNFQIPSSVANGTNYRILITSTNPAAEINIEASSSVFTISSPPNAPVTTGGPACVGSTTSLSASGAVTGSRYLWYNANSGGALLKTSTNNLDNRFETQILSATTNYWVSIINSNGCESPRSQVTATFPQNSPDSQTLAGTNNWIGHVYDGTNTGVGYNGNFTNYFGTYTENENFDQSFGGTNTCFPITSSLGNRSILMETFSVRYRMNSTKKGLYVVDLGSDDGSRLSVDGTLVYNNWSDQAWGSRSRVLMSLTGNSQLVYDYYENGGGNRVTFNNLTRILENKLTGNIEQNLCAGVTAAEISGDTFGTLPAGMSAAVYQWTYSTSPEGTRSNIAGATSASFTPNVNAAPFNNPGTYYIYRNARLSSNNNVSPNPYVATNESNPALLSVNAQPNAPLASNNGPVCSGSTLNLFASTIEGATYSWTGPNGFNSTDQNPQVSTNASEAMAGNYTVTASVDGCTSTEATSIVVINASFQWTGATNTDWNTASNWECNSIPTLSTNVIIPGGLTNNPVLNPGDKGMVKNIEIQNGGRLTIIDNTLQIAGSITNTGDFNSLDGTIEMQGSVSQTIPADTFISNRIRDLIINNTSVSGVTLGGVLEITGYVKAALGDLTTGNNLTLISDTTQTALIDGSGSGQVVGTVKMQRYLDVAFGYKYFSSPFSETVAGDFTDIDLTASFPTFYRYDENRNLTRDEVREDATGWEPITDDTTSINILEGYALNFGTNTTATVVEISGTVNNGSYSRAIENNNREFTRGFHLIGNPYPSPINWDANEGWTKANIENGIYFFTAGDNQYTGTYTSYVDGISSVDGKASNIIPSMQGFFVKVTDPAEGNANVTGTLGVTNKVRVADFDQEFLKTPEREEKTLLRFTASYDGIGKKDGMVIYFSENSVTSFNKEMDAHKLLNTDTSVPNLYSLSKDKVNSSIKALPFPESGRYEKIPLGITAGKSGKMTLNLSKLQNIPSHWNIYLIDKEKRAGQDLRKKASYSFSIDEGEHHSRFQLMFSKERISDPAIAFDDKFSVESRGFLKVKLNLEDGQKGELRVSSVTGQLMEVKEGRGKEQVEFRSITSSGVYFINLYVNEQRYSKKVLVNN